MQIIILIAVLLAAVIGVIASSMTARTFLERIYTQAATAWNDRAPNWEEVIGALRRARKIILISLAITAAVFLFLWLLFFAVAAGLGIYTGFWKSGIILGILFPIWFLFFISPRFMYRIPVLGRIMRLSRWTVTPVVVICAFFLAFALVAPNTSKSLPRYAANQEEELANRLGKDSLQSEPKSGVFARVTEDVAICNESGLPIRTLQKGDIVRLLNLSGTKADDHSEGMVEVMYQDEFGRYSGKKKGRLPSRVLDWNWKRDDVKTANYSPAPPPAPAPMAYVLPQDITPKIPGELVAYWGKNFEWNFKVKVISLDNEIRLEKFDPAPGTMLGWKDADLYSGKWADNDGPYGTFQLCISPNGNIVANGEITTGSGTFPLQLRRV